MDLPILTRDFVLIPLEEYDTLISENNKLRSELITKYGLSLRHVTLGARGHLDPSDYRRNSTNSTVYLPVVSLPISLFASKLS